MGVSAEVQESLAAKLGAIFPHLDERQRRLLAGAEARVLGHGGIRAVARAAGMREGTVSAGVSELEAGEELPGRVRRPGGGRKRAAELDPGLVPALLALVEPDERGDPQSPLRWTAKSLRALAAELTRQGHPVSADTVGDLLHEQGFSLQGNAKVTEGKQHPDRDAQFRYINEQARAHRDAGEPVVSVDAKKKEQAGPYANGGREWRPKGDPARVRDHDFPDEALGRAIPYGIYDVAADAGWVSVGTDHDTAAFAVESIRRWWHAAGRAAYPGAARLLITADAGGSNGYRTRAWKTGIAAFALEAGLEVTVCHFPPGTSKWNAIEHRLFSRISTNWRGRPLTSHEVIVQAIAATTTRTGLRVTAALDTGRYPAGTRIPGQQMKDLEDQALTRHPFHGTWNYTLRPAAPPPPGSAPPPRPPAGAALAALASPALTGMTRPALDALITALDIPAQASREQRLYATRGGPRRQPGTRTGPVRLRHPDRVLATILRDRLGLPLHVLAYLAGVHPCTISPAISDTRQLLTRHGITITPGPAQLRNLADLREHAAAAGITLPASTTPLPQPDTADPQPPT